MALPANPNLAGVPVDKATQIATEELVAARIPVQVHDASQHPEVHANVKGQMVSVTHRVLTFTRQWYYWSVKGLVPSAIALKLYRDPVAPDIRVTGDCGAPDPRTRWVWYNRDGKRIVHKREEEQLVRVRRGLFPMPEVEFRDFELVPDPHQPYDAPVDFVEHKDRAYIDGYHIDSLVGLRVFADVLREAGWR